jgi:hypothetical protein
MIDQETIEQIRKLPSLNIPTLRRMYSQVFGEQTRSSNKQFLVRRLAWRIQAQAAGDLSERARHRIAEIASDKDIRVRVPREFLRWDSLHGEKVPTGHSSQPLLAIHSTISKIYRGRSHVVTVVAGGFEYEDRIYRSLSAIAREITGTQWNGPRFFGLKESRRVD